MMALLVMLLWIVPYTGHTVPANINGLVDLGSGKPATLVENVETGGHRLVFFWATWCVGCRYKLKKTLPDFGQLNDVQVITVNIDKDVARAKKYVDKYGIALPVLLDKSGKYRKQLGVSAVPHWAMYRKMESGKWQLLKSKQAFDLAMIKKLLAR